MTSHMIIHDVILMMTFHNVSIFQEYNHISWSTQIHNRLHIELQPPVKFHDEVPIFQKPRHIFKLEMH